MPSGTLIKFTEAGFYCAQAGVYIDPWRPVDKALITHAHSDHARRGMQLYVAHRLSAPILRLRLGEDINLREVEYGEKLQMNGVNISYHPAGHVLGSAQIRLEYKGEIWVISGDYKLNDDGLSTPYEPVRCHHFVSECTFGLPVFNWQPNQVLYQELNDWWSFNADEGRCTVIFGYSLGKAQRLLHAADPSIGDIYAHGIVEESNHRFRQAGVDLKASGRALDPDRELYRRALVLAPPMALSNPWLRKFLPFSTGNASGWMALRGARRRSAVDRGFVISDHADWKELNIAIRETGAENVYMTHGYTAVFARWLNEKGINAVQVKTEFEGELGEISEQVNATAAEEKGEEG